MFYLHWETEDAASGTTGPFRSRDEALSCWRLEFEGHGYRLINIDSMS